MVVRGVVRLEAEADDAGGLASVRFDVDGEDVAAATAPPYAATWDTRVTEDGPVTVTATATDRAGGAATTAPVTVHIRNAMTASRRLAGRDRWATAARVSEAGFAPGVPCVYIATGTDFPDALAAGGVAAAARVPLLLTARTSLPPATAAELARLQAREIVVVGGHSAVSPGVEATLAAHAPVRRVRGRDRFDTAASLAGEMHPGGAPVVLIASGAGFPDALAAGPAAAALGGPLLLVAADGVPAATADALRRLAPTRVAVLGGAAAVHDEVLEQIRAITGADVVRLRGADRFATSVAVSAATHPVGADTVVLATGAGYADALAGAPAAAAWDAPILLVGRAALPPSVAAELRRLAAAEIVVLGGAGAIAEATLEAALAASR